MIYYILFIVLILQSLAFNFFCLGLKDNNTFIEGNHHVFQKIENLFMILSGIELVSLYSFRQLTNDTVYDLDRYVSFFYSISDGAEYLFLEPGFRYYMYLCSFLNSESVIYILSTFVIPVIVFTFWFIRKYSKNVYLSVYIYYGFMFYFFLFNGVRQCIAIAISLPAFYFINNRNRIKALFFIVLAASFHKSAFILLLLFLLKKVKIKIDRRYFMGVLACSLIMIALGKGGLGIITSLLASSYSSYVENAELGNWSNPLMYLAIVGIICLLNNGKERGKESLLINSVTLGTLIYFMSTQVQILNRMAYYFTIPIICVLPNIISEINNYELRLFSYVGCYLAITMYGCILVSKNAHGILPYVLNF